MNGEDPGLRSRDQGARTSAPRASFLEHVLPEDLIKYGLIPEFVGRLPVVATLENLDQHALVRILQEPKNSLVRQYQTMFELEDVELKFTEDALTGIAAEATQAQGGCPRVAHHPRRTDARADVHHSVSEIKECVITEESANRNQPTEGLQEAVAQPNSILSDSLRLQERHWMTSMSSSFIETDRDNLPVVPLRDMVVFPHMMAPFIIGRERSGLSSRPWSRLTESTRHLPGGPA